MPTRRNPFVIYLPDGRVKCSICGLFYTEPKSCGRHITLKHPEKRQEVLEAERIPLVTYLPDGRGECQVCGFISTTPRTCAEHVKTHDPEQRAKRNETFRNWANTPAGKKFRHEAEVRKYQKVKADPEKLERSRKQSREFMNARNARLSICKQFRCHTSVEERKPATDSQSVHSREDFHDMEIASNFFTILSGDLRVKPYYGYLLLLVDKKAEAMGIKEYLSSVRNDEAVTIYWYYGKNSHSSGPSDYHRKANIRSTPRKFCEDKKLVCYHVATDKFATGVRFTDKLEAERSEFFHLIMGEIQKNNTHPGQCKQRMINERLEIPNAQEKDILSAKILKEASHAAELCSGVICLDNLAGNCSNTHNANQLCSFYGKRHLDWDVVKKFDMWDGENETDSEDEDKEVDEDEDEEENEWLEWHSYEESTGKKSSQIKFKELTNLSGKTVQRIDSQEIKTTSDFVGMELADKAWDILKEPIPSLGFWGYLLLLVDSSAEKMGLKNYIKNIAHDETKTLFWYYGRNRNCPAPSSHHRLAYSSHLKKRCEEDGLICYHVWSDKFMSHNRLKDKRDLGESEFFHIMMGQIQKGYKRTGVCKQEMLNQNLEITNSREAGILSKELIEEATHAAAHCNGVLCLDYVLGNCNVIHNRNSLCRFYGKRHLDLDGLNKYQF